MGVFKVQLLYCGDFPSAGRYAKIAVRIPIFDAVNKSGIRTQVLVGTLQLSNTGASRCVFKEFELQTKTNNSSD